MGHLKKLVESSNEEIKAREMISRFNDLERRIAEIKSTPNISDTEFDEWGQLDKEKKSLRAEISSYLKEIGQPGMIGAPSPWENPYKDYSGSHGTSNSI
jgi:uncharacterized protein YdcH (DUF465 family)